MSFLLPLLLAATPSPAWAQIPAVHGVLQVQALPVVPHDGQPTITLSAADLSAVLYLECPIGDQRQSFTSDVVAPGGTFDAVLPLGPDVLSVTCLAVARFPNGLSERKEVALSWTWAPPPSTIEPPPPPPELAPAPPPPPPEPAPVEESRIKPLGVPGEDAPVDGG